MKEALITFLLCIILYNASFSLADAVCTEALLIIELLQDIKDNNKLDCKREPLPQPQDIVETPEETRIRIEAAWDTDCAFEADYDWLKLLKQNYGLDTGLVDVEGASVKNDFADQADMCEIIRAFIAGGKIQGYKLENLDPQIVDAISCPGDESQTQVCAASGGAATQEYSWYIFLEGISIQAENKPKWKLSSKSKSKLEKLNNDL
jgi:hypothetical protein